MSCECKVSVSETALSAFDSSVQYRILLGGWGFERDTGDEGGEEGGGERFRGDRVICPSRRREIGMDWSAAAGCK